MDEVVMGFFGQQHLKYGKLRFWIAFVTIGHLLFVG